MSTLSLRADPGTVLAEDRPLSPPVELQEQWIALGHKLAHEQTLRIIDTIRQRAADHQLDRGLSISLPYFDDEALALKVHRFQVIPKGRVMFVPAFVVLAAQREQTRVARNRRLSASTRQHLLDELVLLERAFDSWADS
jgi:hypothetical protein